MEEAARYREHAATGASGAIDAKGVIVVEWACGQGHRWDDALDVAQNVRCMNCASQRRAADLKHLHEVALVRGGRLVSSGAIEASMPLDWECALGHTWSARVQDARRHWCAECARTVFARYR